MLPYKPIVSITRIHQERLKPIPSIELTGLLQMLCENSSNSYDRKNHVLVINDMYFFMQVLAAKCGRSYKSFEKQLRLLGFKSRKVIKYESEEDLAEVTVLKWRGKKEQLVNKELEFIEENLRKKRKIVEDVQASIKQKREIIDQQIERIIFSLMVNGRYTQASEGIKNSIQNTRKQVNQTEVDMIKIVNQISSTMGNELELYRLLIYKEGDQYKTAQEDQKKENLQYDQAQNESQDSQKSAAISIKVEEAQEQYQPHYYP